jgi:polygalacturonase
MKKNLVLSIIFSFTAVLFCSAVRAENKESRKVYASQCGAVLNSDVYKGGGTDDTAALQAALDKAPQLGRLHLVLDGAALISKSLRIHSNTTIECPDKSCGLFLANGSNSSVLRNANLNMETICDRNITILGGVFNNNSPGQVHHREEPEDGLISNWVFAMEFYGVENFLMRDVTIANQRTFALLMANWKHVVMENIYIDRREREDYQNQDGLHFWGPGRFLTLRDIRGNAGDDFIALAPDEHDFKSSIDDVLIHGVQFEEADQGIRLLVRGEGKLDRVIIRDVTGTYRSYGFIINPWFEGKGGHYGNIVFDTIDLRPMKNNYSYCVPFLFKLGGNIESITFKNIYQHTPEFNHQLFILGGSYMGDQPENPEQPTQIDRMIVDGLYIDERCEQGIPDSYFLVKSKINLLSIQDVILRRKGVGDAKKGSLIKMDGGLLGETRLLDISADCLETTINK